MGWSNYLTCAKDQEQSLSCAIKKQPNHVHRSYRRFVLAPSFTIGRKTHCSERVSKIPIKHVLSYNLTCSLLLSRFHVIDESELLAAFPVVAMTLSTYYSKGKGSTDQINHVPGVVPGCGTVVAGMSSSRRKGLLVRGTNRLDRSTHCYSFFLGRGCIYFGWNFFAKRLGPTMTLGRTWLFALTIL